MKSAPSQALPDGYFASALETLTRIYAGYAAFNA